MIEQVDRSADDVPCDLVRPVGLWTDHGSQYNPDSHAHCRECPSQPALAHRETTLCRAPVTAGERPVDHPLNVASETGVRSVSSVLLPDVCIVNQSRVANSRRRPEPSISGRLISPC